jgi:hypothetical protein
MNNYDFETIRKMLERALYFYIEHSSEEELKEQLEWYNAEDTEDLVDIMFESYLDSFKNKELINRINYLFDLDNVSEYNKLIAYRNFLEQEDNFDLFELKTRNRIKNYVGCVAFLKDKEHLLKVYEGSENGEEDSVVDYQTFINNYSFKLEVL